MSQPAQPNAPAAAQAAVAAAVGGPSSNGVAPPAATIMPRSPFEAPISSKPTAAPPGPGRGQWLPPPVAGPGMAFNEVFVGEVEPRRVTSILKEEPSAASASGMPSMRLPRNVSWADLETGASLHEVQEYEPSVHCPSDTTEPEDPWRDSRCCTLM